jgi:hypothetical protein
MTAAGLYAFLIDLLLALGTLVVTAALLCVWFTWLAGKATRMAGGEHARRDPGPPSSDSDARGGPDLGPRSASPAARAEIAKLEALWELSREGHGDSP